MSLTGDHSRICKFNGKNDANWMKVGPQLEKYYREALASGEANEHVPALEPALQGSPPNPPVVSCPVTY
jgi:hypothetical protein